MCSMYIRDLMCSSHKMSRPLKWTPFIGSKNVSALAICPLYRVRFALKLVLKNCIRRFPKVIFWESNLLLLPHFLFIFFEVYYDKKQQSITRKFDYNLLQLICRILKTKKGPRFKVNNSHKNQNRYFKSSWQINYSHIIYYTYI